jgi:hypothetical protein
VGGVDPIACEVVCGRLVNIGAEELPMVRAARQMGFGTWEAEKIRIVGDEFPREVCMDFEIPVQIPVRFSLPRVLKSICKQILLVAKATMKWSSSREKQGDGCGKRSVPR